MQFTKKQTYTVTIEKLAFGGRGIAHLDNMVVFVDNALPQEEAEIQLFKIKKNYLEARKIRTIKKSPLEIEPRCKHFKTCGGCKIQNISYENQLAIKESQVKESLEHIGGLSDIPLEPIIACDEPWYYRNKMEFSFGKTEDLEVEIGLHPPRMRYDVFGLQECFLQNEDIGKLVGAIRTFCRENSIEPYNFKQGTGLFRSLTVRDAKRENGRMVVLLTSGESFEHKDEFVEMLTKNTEFTPPTSIYLIQQITKKGQRTRFEEHHLYGEESLTESMKLQNGAMLSFNIAPLAFFQPNTLQAEKLYSKVLELGQITKEDFVYDLFCGTGTIGLFIAPSAKQVFGVDNNKGAIESAQNNAKDNNIKNATFETGDAFEIIKQKKENPSIIIVDPPRAGLGIELSLHIATLKTKRIVYVSCNPTTLARDLEVLTQNGYKLKHVQPVDMFPHTYHIETVSMLEYNPT